MKSKKLLNKTQIKKVLKKIESKQSTIAIPTNADAITKTKFEICKQIIKYMIKNKLSQNELAAKLLISKARVSEICNYRIERYTIDKLLEYYTILKPKFDKLKIAA